MVPWSSADDPICRHTKQGISRTVITRSRPTV
jgi:hypothetical protein